MKILFVREPKGIGPADNGNQTPDHLVCRHQGTPPPLPLASRIVLDADHAGAGGLNRFSSNSHMPTSRQLNTAFPRGARSLSLGWEAALRCQSRSGGTVVRNATVQKRRSQSEIARHRERARRCCAGSYGSAYWDNIGVSLGMGRGLPARPRYFRCWRLSGTDPSQFDPRLSFHLLGAFAVLGRIRSFGESGVATRLGRMAYDSKSSSACSFPC
jgi:hypothetical protein